MTVARYGTPPRAGREATRSLDHSLPKEVVYPTPRSRRHQAFPCVSGGSDATPKGGTAFAVFGASAASNEEWPGSKDTKEDDRDMKISALLEMVTAQSLSWPRAIQTATALPEFRQVGQTGRELLRELSRAAYANDVNRVGDILEACVEESDVWGLMWKVCRAEAASSAAASWSLRNSTRAPFADQRIENDSCSAILCSATPNRAQSPRSAKASQLRRAPGVSEHYGSDAGCGGASSSRASPCDSLTVTSSCSGKPMNVVHAPPALALSREPVSRSILATRLDVQDSPRSTQGVAGKAGRQDPARMGSDIAGDRSAKVMLDFLATHHLVWPRVLRAALDTSEAQSLRSSLLEVHRASASLPCRDGGSCSDSEARTSLLDLLEVICSAEPATFEALWTAAHLQAEEEERAAKVAKRACEEERPATEDQLRSDSCDAESPQVPTMSRQGSQTIHLPDLDPDVAVDLSEARGRPLEVPISAACEVAGADDVYASPDCSGSLMVPSPDLEVGCLEEEVVGLRVERDLLELESQELAWQCRKARHELARLQKQQERQLQQVESEKAAEEKAERALPRVLDLLGCLHAVLHRHRDRVLQPTVPDGQLNEDQQIVKRFLDEVVGALGARGAPQSAKTPVGPADEESAPKAPAVQPIKQLRSPAPTPAAPPLGHGWSFADRAAAVAAAQRFAACPQQALLVP